MKWREREFDLFVSCIGPYLMGSDCKKSYTIAEVWILQDEPILEITDFGFGIVTHRSENHLPKILGIYGFIGKKSSSIVD